jgi:hypothetical protein
VPSVVESNGRGLTGPDDDTEPDDPEHFGGKDDQQLRKAIEILKQKSSLAQAA